jgi:hypothetical protein
LSVSRRSRSPAAATPPVPAAADNAAALIGVSWCRICIFRGGRGGGGGTATPRRRDRCVPRLIPPPDAWKVGDEAGRTVQPSDGARARLSRGGRSECQRQVRRIEICLIERHPSTAACACIRTAYRHSRARCEGLLALCAALESLVPKRGRDEKGVSHGGQEIRSTGPSWPVLEDHHGVPSASLRLTTGGVPFTSLPADRRPPASRRVNTLDAGGGANRLRTCALRRDHLARRSV